LHTTINIHGIFARAKLMGLLHGAKSITTLSSIKSTQMS
jgi:hypothetical protein